MGADSYGHATVLPPATGATLVTVASEHCPLAKPRAAAAVGFSHDKMECEAAGATPAAATGEPKHVRTAPEATAVPAPQRRSVDTGAPASGGSTWAELARAGRRVDPASVSGAPPPSTMRQDLHALLLISRRPRVFVIPVIVLTCCLALGIWGVITSKNNDIHHQQEAALKQAEDLALTLSNQLRAMLNPLLSLASVAAASPNWPIVAPLFDKIAPSALSIPSVLMSALLIAPGGVVRRVYEGSALLDNSTANATSQVRSLSSALNWDIFAESRGAQSATAALYTGLPFTYGPSALYQGYYGNFALCPVVVRNVSANESFAIDQPSPAMNAANCTHAPCYNAARGSKTWGFVVGIFTWKALVESVNLDSVCDAYSFKLTSKLPGMPESVIQSCGVIRDTPITYTLQPAYSPNTYTIYMVHPDGWTPSWFAGALVAVVLGSVVVSFLLLMLLAVFEQRSQRSREQRDNTRKAMEENLKVVERHLTALNHENKQLVRHQEVLKAELDAVMSGYTPKAIIDAGTPADKLLEMMTGLLDGELPPTQDILFVQGCIYECLDIYTPMDLRAKMEGAELDADVSNALMAALGNRSLQQTRRGPSMQLRRHSSCASTDRAYDRVLAEKIVGNGSSGSAAAGKANPGAMSPRATSFGRRRKDLSQLLDTRQSSILTDDGNCGWENLHAALMTLMTPAAMARLDSQGTTETGTLESSPSIAGGMQAPGVRPAGYSPAAQASSRLQQRARRISSQLLNKDINGVEVPMPLMDEVEQVLASASKWQFDAFKLAEVTRDHPLSTLAYFLFSQRGLIQQFDLKGLPLARFLRTVEDGYLSNPYHNRRHAADVLQTIDVILTQSGMLPNYADPLTHMSCLLAAVVHDYEHVGRTNDFLVATRDKLALTYNDKSPMESHHLAAAFGVLQRPEHNFLAELPRSEQDRLRRTVIELVLGTDMKQHFGTVSQFNTVHRLTAHKMKSGDAKQNGHVAVNISRTSVSTGHSGHRSTDGAEDPAVDTEGGTPRATPQGPRQLVPVDEAERMLSLQVALKCADLGHTAAAVDVHLRWVAALEEELFRQGDAEKQRGLPVSPLMDRDKQGITKSQVGFFDIVVIPMYHSFTRVFTRCRPLLGSVLNNYQHWLDQQHAVPTAPASSGDRSSQQTPHSGRL